MNETLADILAEMRDTCGDIADHEVIDYADRIEAAVKRDQAPGPSSGTKLGNAAALREALVKTLDAFKSGAIRTEWNDPDSWKHDDELWYLKNDIESALDAPARNCDRFRTSDEVSAYWGANVHAVPLHGDAYGMHIDGREFATFLDWLFAPAEGGEDSITKRDSVSESTRRCDGVSSTASMLLPWTVEGPFPGQRETKKRHGFAAYANIVTRLGFYVAQGLPPEVAAEIVEAVNERDSLRALVRRLSDELESHYHEPALMDDPCIVREARAALGEEVPE